MFHWFTASRAIGLSFMIVCSFALGCGSGVQGNRVSGKVTFTGKPVPAGKIYFHPDGSKGNSGATGFADIKDGQYDTALEGGQGAPAGAVKITVEGIDPNATPDPKNPDVTTKLLFSGYELAAELPDEESIKDIEVPAEAAKGPIQPKVSNVIIP